jgi:hypothetical protein
MAAQPPAPPAAAAAGAAVGADEREWLLADKQQQLVEELLEVPREELALVLEQAGQAVDALETQVRALFCMAWGEGGGCMAHLLQVVHMRSRSSPTAPTCRM